MAMMRSEAGKCTKPSFIGMFGHQDLSQDIRVHMLYMGGEVQDRTQSSQAMIFCLPVFGRSGGSSPKRRRRWKRPRRPREKRRQRRRRKEKIRLPKRPGEIQKRDWSFGSGGWSANAFFWVVVFSLFKKQLLYSWTGKGGFGKEFHQEEEKSSEWWRKRSSVADDWWQMAEGGKMWRYICHNLMLPDPCCKSAIAMSFMFRDAVKVSIGRCKSVHESIN